MTEIKPCPHCGGEAVLKESHMWARVVCKADCGNNHGWQSTDKHFNAYIEKAITAWNTRHTPASPDAVREAFIDPSPLPEITFKSNEEYKNWCMNIFDEFISLKHIAKGEAARADRYKAELEHTRAALKAQLGE